MITETEVCGIRTLIAPADGPLTAGLVFRVGCADEPLSRRGLTHLVEHLALHRQGLIEHDANAATIWCAPARRQRPPHSSVSS